MELHAANVDLDTEMVRVGIPPEQPTAVRQWDGLIAGRMMIVVCGQDV